MSHDKVYSLKLDIKHRTLGYLYLHVDITNENNKINDNK